MSGGGEPGPDAGEAEGARASDDGARGALSAAERGDTMSPIRRVIVRVSVIAAIAGGVAASVLLARGVLEEVPQLILELNPWSASATVVAAAPSASPSATTAAASASAPASAAAPVPASGTAAPGAPPPAGTFSPYPFDEQEQHLADAAARDDVTWLTLARSGEVVDLAPDSFLALAPRDAPYTLDDLLAQGAAQRIDDTTVAVSRLVFVRPGASLVVDAPGTTLRLADPADGPSARIVAWGASLTLAGTAEAPLEIVGWDSAVDEPDAGDSDPRAYIRVESGSLTATDVALSDLGYWSGPTGGFAVTGTPTTPSTGAISRVTAEGLHIGLYADDTSALAVADSSFEGSAQQGVLLGTRADATSLDAVTVRGSGADGILVRQGVDDLSITDGEVSGSARWGLFADGTPRADGPNPNGYGVENSSGLSIDGTTFRDDAFGAVAIAGTSGVAITGTDVDERGIGIRLTDSQGSVDGNTVRVSDGRGVVFSGALTSARVADNALSGSGPAAVSVEDGASDVDQRDNTTGDWTVKWEILIWIEQHPLALLWALVLVIPVLGIAFVAVRMRRQRRIRELVESTTIALARVEKEQYEAALRGEPVLVGAAAADAVGGGAADAVGGSAADGDVLLSPLLAEALAEADRLDESVVASAATSAPVSAAAGEEAGAAAGTTWLVGGPITGGNGRWAHSVRGSAAPTEPSVEERAPARAATAGLAPRLRAAALAQVQPGHETPSAVESAVASTGRFASVEELAAAAVLDGGKPIDAVARTLRVPTATVAGWVSRARRLRAPL